MKTKTTIAKALAVLATFAAGVFTLPTAQGETRYGLFAGINEYTQGANYLDGCDWDAMRMLDAFTTGGTAQPANCTLLASTDATKAALRGNLNALADRAVSDDVVLYYHSGHGGDYDDEGGSFLCATDDNWYDYEFAEDLERFASGVKVIVVIDTCYSGGMFKSAKGGGGWAFAASVRRIMAKRQRQKKAAGDPVQVAWVTAADSDETSSMEGRGSEFTHRFLEGWEDASADADGNDVITFGELAEYAKPIVENSSVQSYNDTLLAAVAAGSAFDVEAYRPLSFGGRFYGCFGECPESIAIPEGIKEIADCAFDADYCDTSDNLRSVSLPASLRKIGIFAFYGCENLATVTFRGDRAAVAFGDYAFEETPTYDTLFPTPENDDFSDAAPLEGESGSIRGTTMSATMENGDHGDLLSSLAYYTYYSENYVEFSVWYSWTAPRDGYVYFTASSANATARTFAVGATTGYDEANGGWVNRYLNRSGSIGFQVEAGVTYYVSVGSFYGDAARGRTPGDFTLSWSMPMPPENDNFSDAATLLSIASGTFSGTTLAATAEDDEFLWDYDDVDCTVWYKWTAPADGVAVITPTLDETDFLVGVTTGRVTFVEDGDEWQEWSRQTIRWLYLDEDYGEVSSLSFKCSAGTTYYISVGQYSGDGADFAFSWEIRQPPANDAFADATVISGAEGTVIGSNIGATDDDPQDGMSSNIGSSTIWYKWTAPATDSYEFNTFGSRFDTVIYIVAESEEEDEEWGFYEGIASNDDASESDYGESAVYFAAEQGVTYWICVSGYDYEIGDINLNWKKAVFELVISNGRLAGYRGVLSDTLDLTGTGITAINSWVFSGKSLSSVVLPETLESIGERAFYNCSNLASVSIPASVTSIGDQAFANCTSLETVTFEGEDGEDGISMDRASAFQNTPWLLGPFSMSVDEDGTLCVSGYVPSVVEIPDGTVTIPDEAFANATRLTQVTIPEGVASIGYRAFYNCYNLASVTIPASVEEIKNYAFYYCSGLTRVVFRADTSASESSLSIGYHAFERCSNLSSVVFEPRGFDYYETFNNWIEIYEYAFAYCYLLRDLSLGSGVAYVEPYAFQNCWTLQSVSIPASLEDLYIEVFENCTGMTAFEVAEGNQYYSAIDGILYNSWVETDEEYDDDDNFVGIVTNAVYKYVMRCPQGKAGEVVLPSDTTGIYDGAFAGCSKLTLVSIPETLEGTIDEEYAFSDCPAAIEYYEVPHFVLTLNPAYDGAVTLSKKVALDALNIGEMPYPTRPGYAFRGWWTSADDTGWCVDEGTTPADLDGIDTLYAHWAEISYTWSYSLNSQGGATITGISAVAADGDYAYPSGDIVMPDVIDGYIVTALGSYLCTYNSAVTSVRLPAGLIPGYAGGNHAFENLYNLQTIYAPDTIADYESDMRNYIFPGCPSGTTFEYYTPEYKTVTLVPGDGATIGSTEVNTLGAVGNLPIPTRDGYDFMGWWTAPDGGEWLAPETTLVSNITAYAHWQERTLWFTTQPYYFNGSQIGVSITTGNWSPAVHDANGDTPTGRVTVPYGIDGQPVVAIGYCAFLYCSNVTEVELPPTVREIGNYAFYDCYGLTSVSLLATGEQPVVRPQSLRTISYRAFAYCRALASIAIQASVESINSEVFMGCTSLRQITVEDGNANYKTIDGALYTSNGETLVAWPCGMGGDVQVADGTRYIGSYAFRNSPISSVSLPDSLERIEYEAFYSCENLTTIDIPSSVTYIGSFAFAYSGLVAGGVTIGNPDANIESTAFLNTQYDASLPFSMAVSDGVVMGFTGGCPQSIDIGVAANGQTVTAIGDNAFYGYNHDMTPLESVVVPEGVTSIESYAFAYCSNLRDVSLPMTLGKIGYDAFFECYSLTNLVIPASVEHIYSEAFGYCRQLREITIPSSVTNIGSHAFYDCSALQVAYVPSALQSMVESNYVFDGCYNVEIRYYDGDAPTFAVVALDWNDGSGYTEQMVFFQVYDDLPLPRKEGYHVEGWYLEPECVNRVADGDAAEDGITLYANWVETVYEFRGYYDDGNGMVLTYDYDYDSEVGYWRDMPCVSPKPYGRFAVPEEIEGKTVVGISYEAFNNCDEMTEIVIPASVESINIEAFSGCSALTNFVVAEGNEYYSSRDGFLYDKAGETLILCPPGMGGDVIVPEGTKYIGERSFYNNSLVTYVELTEGVETIGGSAFSSCTALEYVSFPMTLRSIGGYAFYGCTAMQSLDFQDGLESIGYAAFRECRSLEYVYLPEGLREIGSNAFAYCDSENFTSVEIPSSVEHIYGYAFAWCSSLVDVTYSETTDVAESAFDRTPWGEANMPFSLEIDEFGWDYGNGPGYLYGYHGGCPSSVEIPSSVRRIGNSVFNGCATLVSVFVPESVTYIEGGAFANCANLTDVVLPSTLAANGYTESWMRSNVFYGCPNVAFTYYHQVTFDLGDNGTLADGELVQLLDDGESAVAPSVAAKPGWRFTGWDRDFSSVTASITVHALYESTVELSIETEATAGRDFVAHITADGIGDGFTWSLAGGTGYSVATNSAAQFVAQDGTGLGLTGDDHYVSYDLPFAFPFFGEEYTVAYPSSNGVLCFGYGISNTSYGNDFYSNPMIAGMWRDMNRGEVTVTESPDCVAFSWGTYYYGSGYSGAYNVNFSVTIYRDGRIVCAYGSGNATGGAVGISAGDGENFVLCSDGSVTSSMENFGKIAFAPMGGIPDGLELSADGTISGVPQESGDFTLQLVLTDENGDAALVSVPLHIDENPYAPPEIDGATPDDAQLTVFTGETLSFAVDARDPNGDGLSYSWLVDGVAVHDADAAAFSTSFVEAGQHTVACRVMNSGWTLNAAEWTVAVGNRVTLDTNGGTLPNGQPGEFAAFGAVGDLPIPTRDGYDFMGWWTARNGGEWLDPQATLDGDFTAYAHWQESIYTWATQDYYDDYGNYIGVSITTGDWAAAVYDANGNDPTGRVAVPYCIDGQPVVAIGYCAFVNCYDVTEVVLPPTVREIGNYAFCECYGLTSVSLLATGEPPVVRPLSLRRIRYRAFAYCNSLASITIPASVESIENSAFIGCTSLREFTVEDGSANYKTIDGALYTSDGETLVAWPCGRGGDVQVADGTRYIDSYAFYDSPISSVSLPDTLERIEYEAFYSCDNLTTIDIPSSVTYVGSYAFAYSGLVAGGVAIGNPDANIDSTAFRGTKYDASLPFSMNVSDGVVTGFTGGCPQTIDIGEAANGQAVTAIADGAFYGYNHDMTPLESVVIPDGVTSIGAYAFERCPNLRDVTQPSTLRWIEYYAFDGCGSLTNLVFPASIEYIGENAFSDCDQLREITIPPSVTGFGYYAFAYCSGLKVAYVPSALQSEVESKYVFSGCYNVEIRYYDGDAPEFATVTLDWNDGSGRTEEINAYQGVLEGLPLPRKEGCHVEGWYLEPECVNRIADGDAAEDGMVLYANWVETVYEFTHYYDNGDGLVLTYDYDYDSEVGYWRDMPCVSPKPYGRFAVPEEIEGKTVVGIDYRAFYDCGEMTEVFIPASVESINIEAFSGCSALTNFVVAEGNEYYSSRDGFLYDKAGEVLILCPPGRGGEVIVPEGTLEIGEGAFLYNVNIVYVELPDSVEVVNQYAFMYAYNLESVWLGSGLVVIDRVAFYDCDRLAEVYIPESVEVIEEQAFYDCGGLADVQGLEDLPEDAYIAPTAFGYTPWERRQPFSVVVDGDAIVGIRGVAPANLDLNDYLDGRAVKEIARYAFSARGGYMCDSLVSVVIPEGVETIGYCAFTGLNRLSSVSLPSTLKSIDDYAFQEDYSLRSIRLPWDIETVSRYAFWECNNLTVEVPRRLEDSLVLDYANVVYYDNIATEDVTYASEDAMPDSVGVVGGVTVSVAVDAEPDDDALAALAGRVVVERGYEGQDAGYYKTTAKYDAQAGAVVVKAEIDEDAVGLSDAVAEVVSPQNLASISAGSGVTLENVVDGFYYGVVVAESIDGVKSIDASGVSLEKAEGGAVSLGASRPSGGSAFFRLVISDRP